MVGWRVRGAQCCGWKKMLRAMWESFGAACEEEEAMLGAAMGGCMRKHYKIGSDGDA